MILKTATATACLALTFLLATGSAQGQIFGPRRGAPPRGSEPSAPALFFSPPGEPFRAAPDQGDPRAGWLKLVDPTSSGTIAAEALVADARRYFAVLDRDKDGAITGPEVTVYENTIVPEILMGAGPGGLQGAARFGLLNDPQPIRSADFNLDYRVTLAEYERKARETFPRLDANRDGVLKVSELPPPPSLNGGRGPGGARPPAGRHPGDGQTGPRSERTRAPGEPPS